MDLLDILKSGPLSEINITKRFDPNQLRDERGRWAREGGGVDPILAKNERRAQLTEREDLLKERILGENPERHDRQRAYVDEAQAHLNTLTKTARVNIRIRNAATLEAILDDGRFKSQFETNTSTGYFGPGLRADVESRLFNIPNNVDHEPENRPIYGYLLDENPSAQHAQESASSYGQIRIVLKKTVNARTTFTGGDSLNVEGSVPEYLPSAVNQPSIASMMSGLTVLHPRRGFPEHQRMNHEYGMRQLDNVRSATKIEQIAGVYAYIEAQIHGGVRVSDIAEVHFPERMAQDKPQSLARLRGMGIRVVIDKRI